MFQNKTIFVTHDNQVNSHENFVEILQIFHMTLLIICNEKYNLTSQFSLQGHFKSNICTRVKIHQTNININVGKRL